MSEEEWQAQIALWKNEALTAVATQIDAYIATTFPSGVPGTKSDIDLIGELRATQRRVTSLEDAARKTAVLER